MNKLVNLKIEKITKHRSDFSDQYEFPVVYGSWVYDDMIGFVCSECKKGYRDMPTLMGKPLFKYCPNCGAKMEGEKDETD